MVQVRRSTCCVVVLFLWSVSTVASREITLGSIIYASSHSSAWSSSDNKFTLGFIQSAGPSSTSFILSISLGSISVWQAGGSDTVVDSGGHFCLHSSGNLRLVNGSKATVWSSGTSGLSVTCAFLEDSGNFVLKNGTVSVWSTFDNPTDTIVPSQNLNLNKFLRNGMYSFGLSQFGDLVLRWNDSVEYWKKRLNSMNVTLVSPSLSIQSVGVLLVSDGMLSSPVKVAFGSDYDEGGADIFWFLKLDSDGNLRMYSDAKTNGVITQQWVALSDQCLVFGFCGDMGICSYKGSSPLCKCASGNFVPVDATDMRKGCRRKAEIDNCTDSLGIVQLEHTEILTYRHRHSTQILFTASSGCRLNCLNNPECVASSSLSDGTGLCYSRNTGFLSGYQSPAFPGTSYIKVCGAVAPYSTSTLFDSYRNSKGSKFPLWVVMLAVLCTVLGLFLLEFVVWGCRQHIIRHGGLHSQDTLLEYASGSPLRFSYKELYKSTNGFKEKLGIGSFGIVYRGVLSDKTVVAVKHLEGTGQGEKHFRVQVAKISSTHHLNLVRLVGFCCEGRHRLLVREFMKNGSLDKFLFTSEDSSGKSFNWEARFQIAVGAARGITYLHEECRDSILHGEIKPENILLDGNCNARVSDFGLMKFMHPTGQGHQTLISNSSTRGYMAPEGHANLTSKSDVYSFGIVLLEMVSGRRGSDLLNETIHKNLKVWAYEEFEKGTFEAILDKRLVHQGLDMGQVMRAIQVILWCIQEEPSLRPTMGKVVQMLEGVSVIEKPPAPISASETFAGTSKHFRIANAIPAAPALYSSFSFQIRETIN